MLFDDDEAFPLDDTDPKQSGIISGKAKVTTLQKAKAPLEDTSFRVLLELEGNGSEEDKPGLDIVVVLDVSGSTADAGKLNKMKSATKFLINILSLHHRLSLVSFSSSTTRLSPLRRMNPEAQYEIGCMVDMLQSGGGTNIAAGLKLAVQILEDRKYLRGRVPAIILVSDGDQGRRFEDARDVAVDKVCVFTIGLGNGGGYNPEVLNTIANRSIGGTFSAVDVENEESDNLHTAFALCLGWLLSVVVLDLQLTIAKTEAGIGINSVLPEYYPRVKDDYSTTIKLGHLCNQEKHSFLVELQLPLVANEASSTVLEIGCSYIYNGEPFDCNPITITVSRSKSLDKEKIEIDNEMKRIETLGKMEETIKLAKDEKFDDAKAELEEAQKSIDGFNSPIIAALKTQLKHLTELMDPHLYKNSGHHIALSMLTSHHRLREAITNDDLAKSNLFDTDATVIFAENIKGMMIFAEKDVESSDRISKLVEYFKTLLKARNKTN